MKKIEKIIKLKKYLSEIPLTEREKSIVAYRIGYNSGIPYTLRATGKAFNISHERVRQIEQKALDSIDILTST